MIQILLTVISYDVWFYISHVLLHTSMLYPFHAEHHSKEEPMFLDAYRGHMFESGFQSLGMVVPCLLYTYTPTEIGVILVILNVRGMMRHDRRCAFLIGDHHLIHHKYPNCNYSEYWVDLLCGTLRY